MKTPFLLGIALILKVFAGVAVAQTHSVEMPFRPGVDPEGTNVVRGYEWATFTPDQPAAHAPGAVLSAPGDIYRYTVMRHDEFARNEAYPVLRAIVGIHIDTVRPSDEAQPWAAIKINGEHREFLKLFPKDSRQSHAEPLVAVISDAEFTDDPKGSFPPYIYDVTDIIQGGDDVSVSIVNLRADGGVHGDAPFAGFIVNRIGAHVWYGAEGAGHAED